MNKKQIWSGYDVNWSKQKSRRNKKKTKRRPTIAPAIAVRLLKKTNQKTYKLQKNNYNSLKLGLYYKNLYLKKVMKTISAFHKTTKSLSQRQIKNLFEIQTEIWKNRTKLSYISKYDLFTLNLDFTSRFGILSILKPTECFYCSLTPAKLHLLIPFRKLKIRKF